VGPDGVGKSTLCAALLAETLKGSDVRHFRFPRLLPRMHKPPAPDKKVVPEKKLYPPSHPRWLTTAKELYLFVDYLLGWTLRVAPHLRRGGWVVIERGWWDMAVDPRRYRLRPPARLVRKLGRFLPPSDVVLVLEASPEAVRARKPQLPRYELIRQMKEWRSILPPEQARAYVDASASFEEVFDACRVEIAHVANGRPRIAQEGVLE
jgi:hypothetical protein